MYVCWCSRIVLLCCSLTLVYSNIYNVKISTERHINLVDARFLSFTIDPKFLMLSNEKYYSKECTCMASALSPAYLRIAGASTTRLAFVNSTVYFDDEVHTAWEDSQDVDVSKEFRGTTVSRAQWEKFTNWSAAVGYDLVFALNNNDKTDAGVWDADTALAALTAADTARVTNLHWQLGYECRNQSIEEYLSDLETLRDVIEIFPAGRDQRWKLVGGDVTQCFQTHSKSDFEHYVTLSNQMVDAIFLNGNSSSRELERMLEKDRLKLLKLLSSSDVPLWLTEQSQQEKELERAGEWLTSLGYAARNGFSVHFRELLEEELHEPTLSFYMALLFKHLVGQRVLDVDMEVSDATLFSHCTSLYHKPTPGALTLYGANMADEPARFSTKLSQREEGGDIMQFILGHDNDGNIVVNSRSMTYEGDIKPIVKRIRPFKTLLINLPPKSVGFWVIANTQVAACQELEIHNVRKDPHTVKVKREVINTNILPIEVHHEKTKDYKRTDDIIAIKERIDSLNKELKAIKTKIGNSSDRNRRQVFEPSGKQKIRHNSEMRERKVNSRHRFSLIKRFLPHMNLSRPLSIPNKPSYVYRKRLTKQSNGVSMIEPNKINVSQKRSDGFEKYYHPKKHSENQSLKIDFKQISTEDTLKGDIKLRKRRSLYDKTEVESKFISSENAIDVNSKNLQKKSKFFHKIKKISELPLRALNKDEMYDEEDTESNVSEITGIELKTKLSKDKVINLGASTPSGIIRSTFEDLLSLLSELNRNLKRVWGVVSLLE